MARVSWNKEDRARAKAEKTPLIMMAFDRSSVEGGGTFMSYSGVSSEKMCWDITALIQKNEQDDPNIFRKELGTDIINALAKAIELEEGMSQQLLEALKPILEKYSVMQQFPLKK